MNIDSRKLLFIQEFLRLNNEDIIIGLEKTMKQLKIKQYEKKIKPISLDQFNEEINQAIEDSRNDKVIKATELRKKWN